MKKLLNNLIGQKVGIKKSLIRLIKITNKYKKQLWSQMLNDFNKP